jgi:hypothetical protein
VTTSDYLKAMRVDADGIVVFGALSGEKSRFTTLQLALPNLPQMKLV